MKKRYKVLIIIFVVLVLAFVAFKIAFSKIEDNLKQLTLTEIADFDLTTAKDGSYNGSYSVFPVSVEVIVTIKDNAIIEIDLIKHDNGKGQSAEVITEKIIAKQSLDVDLISQATYSSKVILKAVEDALNKACS